MAAAGGNRARTSTLGHRQCERDLARSQSCVRLPSSLCLCRLPPGLRFCGFTQSSGKSPFQALQLLLSSAVAIKTLGQRFGHLKESLSGLSKRAPPFDSCFSFSFSSG